MENYTNKAFRKLVIILPIIVAIAFTGYLVANKSKPTQKNIQEEARPLRIITAPAVNLIPKITGYGVAEPGSIWKAIARVQGTVISVHSYLKSGELITAGSELLRIDPTEYEVAIAKLEANIATTTANLKELGAEEENTRRLLEIEQRSLKLAENIMVSKNKLYKSKTIPKNEVDREEKNYLLQKNNVQKFENTLALIPSKRKALEATITAYQANLEQGMLDKAKTIIKAPYACRLGSVDIETGQYIQAGQLLFEAHSTASSEVEANFRIEDLRNFFSKNLQRNADIDLSTGIFSRIFKNIDAVVRLQSGDWSAEWEARIDRLRESLDLSTRTIKVVVTVDNPYAKAIPGIRPPLTSGMFCQVELSAPVQPKSIILPRSAVHNNIIYVLDQENRLQKRAIESDYSQESFTVITSGLSEGERVIVSDPSPAIIGMKVLPILDKELTERLLSESQRKAVVE